MHPITKHFFTFYMTHSRSKLGKCHLFLSLLFLAHLISHWIWRPEQTIHWTVTKDWWEKSILWEMDKNRGREEERERKKNNYRKYAKDWRGVLLHYTFLNHLMRLKETGGEKKAGKWWTGNDDSREWLEEIRENQERAGGGEEERENNTSMHQSVKHILITVQINVHDCILVVLDECQWTSSRMLNQETRWHNNNAMQRSNPFSWANTIRKCVVYMYIYTLNIVGDRWNGENSAIKQVGISTSPPSPFCCLVMFV